VTHVGLPNHFSSIEASESGLLDWLRPVISRKMLEEIAANDYGEEVSEHLAAIERQLSDAPVTGLLGWCPREVLELERWNEPEVSPREQLPDTSYGHRRRLLACTLLLQSAASTKVTTTWKEENFFLDTSASTLIQLTRSAISLGNECPTRALGFLLWLYGAVRYPRLLPFIAFCALLLWLEGIGSQYGCGEIKEVWQWVLEVESRYRERYPSEVESELWLVGISSYEDRDGHRLRWFETAKEVLKKQAACLDEMNEILCRIERIRGR
jgi:hypothetical protein